MRSKVALDLFLEQNEDVTRKSQFEATCLDPENNPEQIIDVNIFTITNLEIQELIQLLQSDVNYFEVVQKHDGYSDQAFQEMLHLSSGNLQTLVRFCFFLNFTFRWEHGDLAIKIFIRVIFLVLSNVSLHSNMNKKKMSFGKQ